jgi:hypothetical protein
MQWKGARERALERGFRSSSSIVCECSYPKYLKNFGGNHAKRDVYLFVWSSGWSGV